MRQKGRTEPGKMDLFKSNRAEENPFGGGSLFLYSVAEAELMMIIYWPDLISARKSSLPSWATPEETQ